MIQITQQPEKEKSGQPVSISDAKKQVNLEPEETEDDAKLYELIQTAIELVESDTNSDILLTDNTLVVEVDRAPWQSLIRITQSPLNAFEKIEQYNNETENYEEIPSADYSVVTMHNWISIKLTKSITAKKLKFTFKTGFNDFEIPLQLKQAILMKVADMYDPERQSYTGNAIQQNNAYRHLISKHIRSYW